MLTVPSIKSLIIEQGLATPEDLELPAARIMLRERDSIAIKIPGSDKRAGTSILFNILKEDVNQLQVVEVARWEYRRPV